jgi:hypothetical protein
LLFFNLNEQEQGWRCAQAGGAIAAQAIAPLSAAVCAGRASAMTGLMFWGGSSMSMSRRELLMIKDAAFR